MLTTCSCQGHALSCLSLIYHHPVNNKYKKEGVKDGKFMPYIIFYYIMLFVFRSNHRSWKIYKLRRKTLVLESLCKNWLQELISNLLNLQMTYPIAKNKSYQNFTTDIVKLKRKQFVGANTLIQWRSFLFINKLSFISRNQWLDSLPNTLKSPQANMWLQSSMWSLTEVDKLPFRCLPILGSCSIMGKPLCCHVSNLALIPHEYHTTRSPSSHC